VRSVKEEKEMKYLSNNIHYFQKAKIDVKTHQKREHLVLRWSKVLDGLCHEKATIFEYKNQGNSRS
jgi:hypothetical protein